MVRAHDIRAIRSNKGKPHKTSARGFDAVHVELNRERLAEFKAGTGLLVSAAHFDCMKEDVTVADTVGAAGHVEAAVAFQSLLVSASGIRVDALRGGAREPQPPAVEP